MAAVPQSAARRHRRSSRLVAVLLVALLAGVVLTASAPAPAAVAANGDRAVHVAGGGVGDDGPGVDAVTRPSPRTVVRLPRGEVGWFDFTSQQIRVRTPDGTVSDLFGNGRRFNSEHVGELDGAHARYTALPSPSAMWATPDGSLWLAVNSRMLRINPVTHRLSVHFVPQVNGGTEPLLVRRDGSLVVALHDASGPRAATLAPGWAWDSPLTTLVARPAGRFAETPDGTLYEAYGAGVYRHRPGSTPELVAGTAAPWPTTSERPDGPALGAPMQPVDLDVDATGRVAVVDRSDRYLLRVRVIAPDATGTRTVRTVSEVWSRGGDGCVSEARPLWQGDRVLVPCAWSLRGLRPDGADAGGRGTLVVGRGEEIGTRDGSPSGTEAHRAYLPGTAHDLQLPPYGDVGIISTVDARIARYDTTTKRRRVDVVATAADAAAGLGWPATVSWRAAFVVPNEVVALVCRDAETCVVRRRDTDEVWSTVAWPEGGARSFARLWEYDRGGKRLYFAMGDGPLEYLDLTTRTFGTVDGLASAPERVAPLQDGRLLLATPGAGTATLLDPATGRQSPTQVPVGLDWAPQRVSTQSEHVWVTTGDTLRLYTLQGQFYEVDRAAGLAARRADGMVAPFPGVVYANPSGNVLTLGDQLHDVTVHRFTVAAAPPAAPPNVRVVPGDGRVTVTWGAADPRGSVISSYVVRSHTGSSWEVPATQRSLVVTAPNDVSSHYTVSTTSSAGRGEPSSRTAWAVPRDTTPPQPVTLGTTGYGVGSMTLRWSLATDPDRAEVVVTRRAGLSSPGCTAAPGTTVVYRGTGTTTTQQVTPGTSYYFAVCTRDRVGNLSAGRFVKAVGTRSTVVTTADGTAVTAVTYGTTASVVHTARLREADGSDVGGAVVSLQARPKGSTGAWSTVARATTSAGTARLVHRPSAGTEYRVHHAGGSGRHGSLSPVRVLDVRTAVTATASATTARRGSSVTISGKVAPDHARRLARLQVKTSSGWSTVAEQKLSSTSTYRFPVTRSRSAATATVTYRVVPVPKPGYVAGASPSRSVRWT